MNTIDYGNILKTKLNVWKAKMYDLTGKGASCELKEREKVLRSIQDLKMPIIEKSSRIEQMKNERRTEFTPQGENIDNGFVDMHLYWAIVGANMCSGPSFPGQGFTANNRGRGKERCGRRFEETATGCRNKGGKSQADREVARPLEWRQWRAA